VAFRGSSKDWLFLLLGNAVKDQRPKIVFLLWRVWHHRNNVVHGDGKASISASVPYLVNYHRSFLGEEPEAGIAPSWTAPAVGAVKGNVDAGWDSTTRRAGIGIIIRDHLGSTLLAEWRFIPSCGSAEEAEILACLEGLK
jgi:hypothetical protein